MSTEHTGTSPPGNDHGPVEVVIGRSYPLAPAAGWIAAIHRSVRWLVLLAGAVLFLAVSQSAAARWLLEHLPLLAGVLPLMGLHIALALVEHKRWSWCLREHDFVVRSGLFTQRVVSIPLARVQQVDVHSGVLDRRLGIAGLQIHSAGSRAARVDLPGLEPATAAALQARLTELGDQLAL